MNKLDFTKFACFVGIIAQIFCLSAIFISTFLCGAGCGNPIPPPFDEINEWASDGSFSWWSNALSDMGISKVALIFNPTLILFGMLDIVFYVGFLKAYSKSVSFHIGGILLLLGSVSASLCGVFTEAYPILHIVFALAYFVLVPIGLILIGFAFVRMKMKKQGCLSISVGAVALLVMFIQIILGSGGIAISEIIAIAVKSVWIVWMSLGLTRLKQVDSHLLSEQN